MFIHSNDTPRTSNPVKHVSKGLGASLRGSISVLHVPEDAASQTHLGDGLPMTGGGGCSSEVVSVTSRSNKWRVSYSSWSFAGDASC